MAAEAPEPPRGVGKTALGVAAVRARESRRPDRLFDDPYASVFLDAASGALPGEQDRVALGPMAALGAVFFAHAVLRTRFFDDHLLAAAAAGCRQVVLLAAGLDTRAFRLPWPDGLRLFELDLPQVLTFKEHALAGRAPRPRCGRTIVPADLRQDWTTALTAAGFDASVPTAWLAEGLLLYLSAQEATGLLVAIGDLSAPGSRFACENGSIAENSLLIEASTMPAMAEYTPLWKGGLGAGTPDWLRRHGWLVDLHDLAAVAAAHGRSIPDATTGGFLTAVRTPSP